MPGSMATGFGAAEGMSGGMECGRGRRTLALTGPILTTITTSRAGPTTRVTGAMKTTATTTIGIAKDAVLIKRGPAKKFHRALLPNLGQFSSRLIQHFKIPIDLPGSMKICLGQITDLSLRGNLYVLGIAASVGRSCFRSGCGGEVSCQPAPY